jgi:hypothetical protein
VECSYPNSAKEFLFCQEQKRHEEKWRHIVWQWNELSINELLARAIRELEENKKWMRMGMFFL